VPEKPGTPVSYALGIMKTLTRIGSQLYFIAAVSGCKDSAVIWSKDVESPDHRWVASAHTEQLGGPGTAAVITSVSLHAAKTSRRPLEILSLENASAYPGGITNIEMNWKTANQLELIYRGDATIDFQAVKVANVEVSVAHR